MRKLIGILLVGMTCPACGQVRKQLTVETPQQCQAVELAIKAKTGNCYLKPSPHPQLLNIYSNQDLDRYAHSFQNELLEGVSHLRLALEQDMPSGVGQMISSQVFGGEGATTDKIWKVYLTDSKPYSLQLEYGLGNANIDLSGLAINRLKINTASADVYVGYAAGVPNKVEMDTFCVKVDVGSVNVRQIHLARTKVVVADVGFGNMLLDFSMPQSLPRQVNGTVGAGNLIILLPADEVPVRVNVSDSWLCSVNLSRSLHKVGANTFANRAYTRNPKGAVNFDLDVALGKIVFKEK
jgi:hypothetical protein